MDRKGGQKSIQGYILSTWTFFCPPVYFYVLLSIFLSISIFCPPGHFSVHLDIFLSISIFCPLFCPSLYFVPLSTFLSTCPFLGGQNQNTADPPVDSGQKQYCLGGVNPYPAFHFGHRATHVTKRRKVRKISSSGLGINR